MTSKLCAYFQGPPERSGDKRQDTEVVIASRMPMVRWIDPDSRAPDNPFRGRQRVLARLYMPDGDEAKYMERGPTGARQYAELMKPRIAKLGTMGIFDVGGPNEPHPTQSTAATFDGFWCELTTIYQAMGLKLWGWDWGVGWPGLKYFDDQDFSPGMGLASQTARSVELMRQAGGGVVVHEYNAPSMINPNGNNDNAYTYRLLHTLNEWVDAGVDVDNLSVIIGECGIDRGVIEHGVVGGWQSFSKWAYPAECGLPAGIMNVERYFAQLSAYDDGYSDVKQVRNIFSFIVNPWEQWRTYNSGGPIVTWSAAKYEEAYPIIVYGPPLATSEAVRPLTLASEKAIWHIEETIRCIEGDRQSEALERLWALRDYIREVGEANG